MEKIVTIPSHITGDEAQNNFFNLVNADPHIGTNVKSGSNILVSGITTTSIGDCIGSSLHSLSNLCATGTINQWSYYKPNGDAPYKMGDFAGYNHLAKPPTYYASHPVYDPGYPVDLYIQPNGLIDYMIKVDCALRRGDLIPTHGSGESDWSNIDVTFSLRTLAGGGGGVELSSATVYGVSVTSYTYNTVVVAYIQDYESFDIPNVTTDYRLRVTATYANGTPATIEDGVLNYYVTALKYEPEIPPSWSLGMFELPIGNLKFKPGTGSVWNTALYNESDGAYYGDLKAEFDYYVDPDGYPTVTNWYGTAAAVLIPELTTNDPDSVTTVAFTSDGAPIGDIDTGHAREVRVYYYNGTAWVNFATYDY